MLINHHPDIAALDIFPMLEVHEISPNLVNREFTAR